MIDIENCPMQYRCHQRWEHMERVVGNPRMRFCLHCQTVVHRPDDETEFAELARKGKCVAVFPDASNDGLPDLLGIPCPGPRLRVEDDKP
jgi:hypothetical protein